MSSNRMNEYLPLEANTLDGISLPAFHNPALLIIVACCSALIFTSTVMRIAWPISLQAPLTTPPTLKLQLSHPNVQPSIAAAPLLLPEHSSAPVALPRALSTPSPTQEQFTQPNHPITPAQLPPPTTRPTPPVTTAVFNPKLRTQLNALPQPLHQPTLNSRQLQTYTAASGDTMVSFNGRCYRVFDDELSPTGKSWSLPTRCQGHKTESDHIAEGLRQAMQQRFGQHNK